MLVQSNVIKGGGGVVLPQSNVVQSETAITVLEGVGASIVKFKPAPHTSRTCSLNRFLRKENQPTYPSWDWFQLQIIVAENCAKGSSGRKT